jgi:hypothetical protein
MFAGAHEPEDGMMSSSTRAQMHEETQSRIEAKRTELQAKLQGIRDERKKAAVERIQASANKLNERMTDHFTNVLDQIDEMLHRVESRASKAEANSLDISAVTVEIANAQGAITDTREAVEAQAGKVYAVLITGSETTLRSDAGATRQALHADLTAVRDMVKAARDATRKAAVALAQIPRVDEVEATTTP